MRTILLGAVAGVAIGLVAVAGLGIWDAHADSDGYLTEPFAWLSPLVAACLWMLLRFGPIAAVAGGLIGGGVGAALGALRRIGPAILPENNTVRRGDRVLAVIMWGMGGILDRPAGGGPGQTGGRRSVTSPD